jgi:hypothetical protein
VGGGGDLLNVACGVLVRACVLPSCPPRWQWHPTPTSTRVGSLLSTLVARCSSVANSGAGRTCDAAATPAHVARCNCACSCVQNAWVTWPSSGSCRGAIASGGCGAAAAASATAAVTALMLFAVWHLLLLKGWAGVCADICGAASECTRAKYSYEWL